MPRDFERHIVNERKLRWFDLLLLIASDGGAYDFCACKTSEWARAWKVTPQGIAGTMRRLDDDGLVEYRPWWPIPGRPTQTSRVRLTEDGRHLLMTYYDRLASAALAIEEGRNAS